MKRPPPRTTRTDTLVPSPPLFLSNSIPRIVTAPRQERPSDRCQAQPVLQPRRHVLLHRCESSKWFYLPLAKPAIFKLNAAGLCSFVMGRSLVKDRREVGSQDEYARTNCLWTALGATGCHF